MPTKEELEAIVKEQSAKLKENENELLSSKREVDREYYIYT